MKAIFPRMEDTQIFYGAQISTRKYLDSDLSVLDLQCKLISNPDNTGIQASNLETMETKQRVLPSNSFKDTLLHGEIRNIDMGTNNFLPTPQKSLQHSEEGLLKLSFSDEEMTKYCEDLQFTLVGKFSFGYPETKDNIKTFMGFKLKGAFTIGVLNNKHVLIKLKNENDYLRIWEKNTIWFNKYPTRVLKWDKNFNIQKE